MREIAKQIRKFITQGARHIYCFTISIKSSDKDIHLNSSDKAIICKGINFLPRSGLQITEMKFDDNGQNYVTITGIYEEGGITKNTDLRNSKFKIFLCFDSKILYHILTYSCARAEALDLSFKLTLQPESIKYHTPLLKRISKTCRARLGDDMCKVDMQSHNAICEIESISGGKLLLKNFSDKYEDGYFTFGTAIFGSKISCPIKSHIGGTIEIEGYSDKILAYDHVTLYAGCDKEFSTCASKFNNSINFRGEPFLPDFKSIKIL